MAPGKSRVAAVLALLVLLAAAGCGRQKSTGFLYRDRLAGSQLAAYQAFEQAMREGFPEDAYYELKDAETGEETAVSEADALCGYQAFLYDHPELFRLGRSFGFRRQENAQEPLIEAICPLLLPSEDPSEAQHTFEQALEEALRSVPPRLSETETAEYLYRYLTERVSYCEWAVYDESLVQEHTAYGALVGRSAVCDGISLAYLCLLRQSGIDCAAVPGTAGGMRHVWVILKADGEWTEADPAWGLMKGTAYFGLSTKEMSTDHVRDPDGIGSLAPSAEDRN